MVDQPSKSFRELVEHLGRYPEDAFLFVRDGLNYTAERLHGPETEIHRQLHEYLGQNGMDWTDLAAQYLSGSLPEPVVRAIDSIGGCEKINRHVSGRELCWGLRDYALERWGLLARTVLESWRVRSTLDFGQIVFGFIDFDLMRKQPEDDVADFKEVYTFAEAFEAPYLIEVAGDEVEAEDATEEEGESEL